MSGSRPIRLGEPIFLGRPRYTATVAFRPDPQDIERPALLVEAEGLRFFDRPRWQKELRKAVGGMGEFETVADADGAVRTDMRSASRRISEKCPNRAALQLCYPWYARDARADRLAQEAGIEVAYGGITVNRRRSPAVLRRLPADFLWRLPGPGRISLPELVRRRIRAVQSTRRSSEGP